MIGRSVPIDSHLYAESSAVLAWLLGETAGVRVRQLLMAAKAVVALDLTLVECDRVLIRAVAVGDLTESDAVHRRTRLTTAASHWHVLRIGQEIIDRARHPFPGEPIRTLDAIQLASALTARSAVTDLELLSLDERIRNAGHLLGFQLWPE